MNTQVNVPIVDGVDSRKKVCGKFPKNFRKKLFLLIFLAVLFVSSMLLAFVILPNQLASTYEDSFQFREIHISKITIFPSNQTDLEFKVTGSVVHPQSLLGYQGALQKWTFLNKDNTPIFDSQPIQECDIRDEIFRKVFRSNMKIKVLKESTDLTKLVNDLFYSNDNNSIYSSGKILFSANFHSKIFATYRNLNFFIPIKNIPKIIARKNSSAAETSKVKYKFSKIQLALGKTGLHLSHQMRKSSSFILPPGSYPIYTGRSLIPIMILHGHFGRPTSKNRDIVKSHVEIQFLKNYADSGALLFSVLLKGLYTSAFDLKLGSRMDPHAHLDLSSRIDIKQPIISPPSFQSLFERIRMSCSKAQIFPKVGAIRNSEFNAIFQVKFPLVVPLETFISDLGLALKFQFEATDFFELRVTNFKISTKNGHHIFSFSLNCRLPPYNSAIRTLSKLHEFIFGPNRNLEIQFKKLQFFSTASESQHVECEWCDVLFSSIPNSIPLATESLKSQLKAYFPSLGVKESQGSSTPFLKLEKFYLTQNSGLPSFGILGSLNMSCFGIVNNPDWDPISPTEMYISNSKIFSSEKISEHLETLPANHGLITIDQEFMMHWLQFQGLSVKDADSSQSMTADITLPNFLAFITKTIHASVLSNTLLFETSPPFQITPLSIQFDAKNDQTYCFSIALDVNPPLPFSIEVYPLAFKLNVENLETFYITLPAMEFKKLTNSLVIHNITVEMESIHFLSKIFLKMPSNLHTLFPLQLNISDLAISETKVESNLETSPYSPLNFPEGFTRLTYALPLVDQATISVSTAELQNSFRKFEIIFIEFLYLKRKKSENKYIFGFEMEYTWNIFSALPFFLRTNLVSFDLVFFGGILCHIEIFGLNFKEGLNQKVQFQVHLSFPSELSFEKNVCQQDDPPVFACIQRLKLGNSTISKSPQNNEEWPSDLTLKFSFKKIKEIFDIVISRETFKDKIPIFRGFSKLLKLEFTEIDVSLELIKLSAKVIIPNSRFSSQKFSTEVALMNQNHSLIKITLSLNTLVSLPTPDALDLTVIIEFLPLFKSAVSEKRSPPRTLHEQIEQISQTLLHSPVVVGFGNSKAEGCLAKALQKIFPISNSELPFTWADILTLKFKKVVEFKQALQKIKIWTNTNLISPLSANYVEITNQLISFDNESKRALVIDLCFNLFSNQWIQNISNLKLKVFSVDVLVNGQNVGIFRLVNDFHCEQCTDANLSLPFAYRALVDPISKCEIAKFFKPFLSEDQTSSTLQLLNLRSHLSTSDSPTVLSLFSFSVSTEELLKWIDDEKDKLSSPTGGSGLNGNDFFNKIEPKVVDKPDSIYEIPAVPPSQIEIRVKDISFYFEEAEEISFAIAMKSLTLQNGKLTVHGLKFRSYFLDEEADTTKLTNFDLTLVNLRIGDFSSFSKGDSDDCITGFDLLVFSTGFFIDRNEHIAWMKSLYGSRIEYVVLDRKFLRHQKILETRLIYGNDATRFLPNLEIEYALSCKQLLHLKGTNLFLYKDTGISRTLNIDLSLNASQVGYCDPLQNSHLRNHFFNSITFSDQTRADESAFTAREVALYLDEEVEVFFSALLTNVWYQGFITKKEFSDHQSLLPPSKGFPFVSITAKDDANTTIRAMLHLFTYFPVILDINYLKFQLTYFPHEDEDKSASSVVVEINELTANPFSTRFVTIRSKLKKATSEPNEISPFESEGTIIHSISIGESQSSALSIDGVYFSSFWTKLLENFAPEGKNILDLIFHEGNFFQSMSLEYFSDHIFISSGEFTYVKKAFKEQEFHPYSVWISLKPAVLQQNFIRLENHFFQLRNFDLRSHDEWNSDILIDLKSKSDSMVAEDFLSLFSPQRNPDPMRSEKDMQIFTFSAFKLSGFEIGYLKKLLLPFENINLEQMLVTFLREEILTKNCSILIDFTQNIFPQIKFSCELPNPFHFNQDLENVAFQASLYYGPLDDTVDQWIGTLDLYHLIVSPNRINGTLSIIKEGSDSDLSTKTLLNLGFVDQKITNDSKFFHLKVKNLQQYNPNQDPMQKKVIKAETVFQLAPKKFSWMIHKWYQVNFDSETKVWTATLLLENFMVNIPFLKFHYVAQKQDHPDINFFLKGYHWNSRSKIVQLEYENPEIAQSLSDSFSFHMLDFWIGPSENGA